MYFKDNKTGSAKVWSDGRRSSLTIGKPHRRKPAAESTVHQAKHPVARWRADHKSSQLCSTGTL